MSLLGIGNVHTLNCSRYSNNRRLSNGFLHLELLIEFTGRWIVVSFASSEGLGDLKRRISRIHRCRLHMEIGIVFTFFHLVQKKWIRGLDSNQRPLGNEPSVLPLNYPGIIMTTLQTVDDSHGQDSFFQYFRNFTTAGS